MDENHLIRRAQAGDAAAFSALLEARYDTLYRFAWKWCGNRPDAEDITQQCCLQLARKLAQFRFESAFSTWLYTLVIHCAQDWQRSQKRHADEWVDVAPEESVGSPDSENAIYLQQVLQQLQGLGEGFRETAVLVHGLGMSHAEAAGILAVKESTVSWRLHEIRQHFQRLKVQEANE